MPPTPPLENISNRDSSRQLRKKLTKQSASHRKHFSPTAVLPGESVPHSYARLRRRLNPLLVRSSSVQAARRLCHPPACRVKPLAPAANFDCLLRSRRKVLGSKLASITPSPIANPLPGQIFVPCCVPWARLLFSARAISPWRFPWLAVIPRRRWPAGIQ